VERGGQLERLFGLVEPDRLPDVVDDDPARVAALEVLLERIADGRIQLAIDILVQRGKQFFALHCFQPGSIRSAAPNESVGYAITVQY